MSLSQNELFNLKLVDTKYKLGLNTNFLQNADVH